MKNIISGIMTMFIVFLLIFIMAGMYGRTTRKQELENALNNGMQIAVEMIAEDSAYAPTSNEELIADLEQAMIMQLHSAINELTINVVAADYKKGILKVEAVATYPHLSGGEGTVSVTKTIILDYYQEERQKQEYKIYYYINGKLYRSYTVNYGGTVIVPPSPEMDGKTFKGWKAEDGTLYQNMDTLMNVTVTKGLTFQAVFE